MRVTAHALPTSHLSSLLVETERNEREKNSANSKKNKSVQIGAFTLSLLEDTAVHDIIITPPAFTTQTTLQGTSTLLKNIITQIIVPDEKYAFKIEVKMVKIDEFTPLLQMLVLGCTLVLIAGRVPMCDTPVSYTKRYKTGSIWVCKSYFSDSILSTYITGEIEAKDVLSSTTVKDTTEVNSIMYALEQIGYK